MYGAAGAAEPGDGRPGATASQAAPRATYSGAVNRLVVFADACGSGAMGLETKKRMRVAMYAAFGEAFAAVGVAPGKLHMEDRGDGILAALPADVPPSLMVGRWLSTFYENLREQNHGRSERLRVRVGMHMGPVYDDSRGLVGRAVDLTCRLCDSDTAKRVMRAAPGSDLMIVVSDWLYTEVVAEGGRHIEPRQYRSGRVRSKETDEAAWFHVPGLAKPPGEAVSAPGNPTAVNPAAEPGRDGGPLEGDGSPSPGADPTAPQPSLPAQEFHVRGDNLSVSGSTIHGGFTGFRKEKEGRPAPGDTVPGRGALTAERGTPRDDSWSATPGRDAGADRRRGRSEGDA
ncbi:hypothetical protein [Streptomyces sp. NPDC051561]|uniref:hypothetical protein n=1 Tax=Streptomyces sp. NPDC051561 TaxID=3365658 RepID=UPI00379F7228